MTNNSYDWYTPEMKLKDDIAEYEAELLAEDSKPKCKRCGGRLGLGYRVTRSGDGVLGTILAPRSDPSLRGVACKPDKTNQRPRHLSRGGRFDSARWFFPSRGTVGGR